MIKQLSENYILNPLIEIKGYQDLKDTLCEEDDLNATALFKLKKGELFLLTSIRKSLLINPTIKLFLSFFETTNTLATVSEHIAKEAQATVGEVLPTVQKFFDDMLFQGVLIPETQLEEALQHKLATEVDRPLVFPIGSTIEGYTILDILFEQRSFDLYLAEDLRTKQQVVVKTLFVFNATEKEVTYRTKLLRQEFNLLKEVKGHPNICKYIGSYFNQQYAFGVMEYIKGQSLERYLRTKQPTLKERIHLIQQVFDAVAHVHQCGIVHGDIHKKNFLITESGQIKLFDFDLANHHKLQKNEIKRKGGVYGYFPPEKIRKNSFHYIKGKADYRSEVYQTAIIAYFLLYERLPFKALTWQELAKKIKKEQPLFNNQLANKEVIPLPLIAILERALAKKPKQRFKSAITLGRKWTTVSTMTGVN